MEIINEKSSAYLTITFRDKAGRRAAPTAVTYRVDCETNGAQVKPWTAADAVADSLEITLSADDNAILGANERETRRVTVVAAYGVGNADQATNDYTYQVRNLNGLT